MTVMGQCPESVGNIKDSGSGDIPRSRWCNMVSEDCKEVTGSEQKEMDGD